MENRRPKLWIVVLIVLAAAALVYTFAGAASIKATADKIEFVQKESYGDPSAAEGITAEFRNYKISTGRICWQTELSNKDGKDSVSAVHSYSTEDYNWTSNYAEKDLTVFIWLNDWPSLEEYAGQVAQDIGPGQNKAVEVKLADYMDQLPVMAQYALKTPNTIGVKEYYNTRTYYDPERRENVLTDEVNSVLREMFRIKPPAGMKASITVFRYLDSDNEKFNYNPEIDWSGYPVEPDLGIIYGSYYDGAFYIYDYTSLYSSRRLQLETLADGSTPYKIYRIPVEEKYEETTKSYRYDLDAENITVTGEYEEGFVIMASGETPDGSKAIVFGAAGGRVKAVIIDFAAGGSITTLDICAKPEIMAEGSYGLLFRDDYMILDLPGKGYYVVYPDGGSYKVFCAPTDGTREASEYKRYRMAAIDHVCDMVFSDGRLAVAGFAGEVVENNVQGQTYKGMRGTGISLAVYSEKGLEYFTRYESTLFETSHGLIDNLNGSVEVSMK